jgi:predicted  nucleic acid-binding Zn-ribbon protein
MTQKPDQVPHIIIDTIDAIEEAFYDIESIKNDIRAIQYDLEDLDKKLHAINLRLTDMKENLLLICPGPRQAPSVESRKSFRLE